MICLRNIVKQYDRVVLDNISINFACGKIYVLKGISGSGKTTLLNIISGLDRDYEGEYLYFGIDRKKNSINDEYVYQKNTNYIFQQSLLISHLNILDNLLFINYDIDRINMYAKKFGVEKLLNKYPNQLSGGERQRISIIRALLTDSNLLIIDEATSSLDLNNSLEIAKEISKLKNDNKIIIIATHKPIYDDMADEIIHIKDGKIVSKKEEIKDFDTKITNPKIVIKKRYDFKYALNRFLKKGKNMTSIIVTALFILVILLIFGFKQNFKDEFLKVESNNLPFHVLPAPKEIADKLRENKNIRIYEEYKDFSDNLYIMPLLNKEDSIFGNINYLMYGSFPKNNQEVLVDDLYVKEYLNNIKLNEAIGIEIMVLDNKFIISGIINDQENRGTDIYLTNPFYSANDKPMVFVPYDKIKQLTKIEENNYYVLISYKDVYEDIETYNLLLKEGVEFPWNRKIESAYENVNTFLNIILIVSSIIIMIAFMFLYNQITLELHYRNKEFGYLRLFHINKKRLSRIVLSEYFIRIFLSFIISILLLIIVVIIINLKYKMMLFPSLYVIIMTFLLSIIYIYFLTIFPLRKTLKKSILELIK